MDYNGKPPGPMRNILVQFQTGPKGFPRVRVLGARDGFESIIARKIMKRSFTSINHEETLDLSQMSQTF